MIRNHEIYLRFDIIFGGNLQCPNSMTSPSSSWLNTTQLSCKTEPSSSTFTITAASWHTEGKPTEECNKFQKKSSHLDSRRSYTVLITKMFSQDQLKEVFWFSSREDSSWTTTNNSNSPKSSTFALTVKEGSIATTISSLSLCDHPQLLLFVFAFFLVLKFILQECSFLFKNIFLLACSF